MRQRVEQQKLSRTSAKKQQMVERLASSAEELADSVEETASALEELGKTVEMNASGAEETSWNVASSQKSVDGLHEKCLQRTYDLLLCDVNMPVIDGF